MNTTLLSYGKEYARFYPLFNQKLEKQVYIENIVTVNDRQLMTLANYGTIANISLENVV